MTETWFDLASDARRAANELVASRYRSCVARAYYAAYSRVTHALVALPHARFPIGREGPNHPGETGTGGIRRLIETSMSNMTEPDRLKLSEWVGRLYTLRTFADYRPSVEMDARDAREAMSLLKNVFDAV
jgi:uncharacterized protein (UPF0332 family)